jgi:ribonuclease HI
MSKQKYYVVWKGRKTGIFTTWAECEKQVKGFVGAQFKAFGSEAEADAAYLANMKITKAKPPPAENGGRQAFSPNSRPFVWMRRAAARRVNWNIAACNTETGDEIFMRVPMLMARTMSGNFLPSSTR